MKIHVYLITLAIALGTCAFGSQNYKQHIEDSLAQLVTSNTVDKGQWKNICTIIMGYLHFANTEYCLYSPYAETIANLLPGEPIILPDSIEHARALGKKNPNLEQLLRENTFAELINNIPGVPLEMLKIQFIGHTGAILTPAKTQKSSKLAFNPLTGQVIQSVVFGFADKDILAPSQFGKNKNNADKEAYYITTSGDKTARIWNIDRETSFILYGHTSAVVKARFSPNNTSVVTGDREGTVIYWNFETHQIIVCKAHKKEITDITFEDANMFWTTSKDGKKYSWIVDEQNNCTELVGGTDVIQQTVKYSYSTDLLKLKAPVPTATALPAPAPAPQEDIELKAIRKMGERLRNQAELEKAQLESLVSVEAPELKENKKIMRDFLLGKISWAEALKHKKITRSNKEEIEKQSKKYIQLEMDIEDLKKRTVIRNHQIQVADINKSVLPAAQKTKLIKEKDTDLEKKLKDWRKTQMAKLHKLEAECQKKIQISDKMPEKQDLDEKATN